MTLDIREYKGGRYEIYEIYDGDDYIGRLVNLYKLGVSKEQLSDLGKFIMTRGEGFLHAAWKPEDAYTTIIFGNDIDLLAKELFIRSKI